jgi:peptidoglycan hydrolase-like protein with peptidoglycan-binding domain
VALSQRRLFILHWPVMGDRPNHQWARDIEAMHARSITSQAAPAYNYLVSNRPGGEIMEGCGRDVRGPASGTNDANITGIAVCILQPSTAQGRPTAALSEDCRRSVRALYEHLNRLTGRTLQIRGHRQIVSTACPGPDIFAWLSNGMQASGGQPAPPAPPAGGGGVPAYPGVLMSQRQNQRHPGVRTFQQQLVRRGWGSVLGAADGVFGARTDAAVKGFQRNQRIGCDGVVGPATWPRFWNGPGGGAIRGGCS